VKRLLPCVILALAFHAIILSTDVGWLKLVPHPTPAAKSLSITLSADQHQRQKAQTAVPDKTSDGQIEPRMDQSPGKNPDAMPAPARVEHTAQRQKPLPATPPKNIVKQIRQKKSLKALTYKKQRTKTIEATLEASDPEREIPPKAEAKIFSPTGSGIQAVRPALPADTAFIKKTHRVPHGFPEPTTTAAMPPDSPDEDTLSGAVLKIARPLYKRNTSPPYPSRARRMGYEGIVMLKVLVDENGRVDDLTLLESSGYAILDQAALSAVKKWLFEPGTESGMKKKMWVKIPIRFQLE